LEDNDMTVMSLDRIDIKILNELQQNASLTNVELATRVNLSPSPCLARVRHLEKVGVIDRRIAVLDPCVLGLSVTAFIHIKLERQVQLSLDNFTRAIDRISQVMECYLMTGESDYLLRVLVPDIQDLEDLIVNKLSRIQGVSSIKSNLALKKISHKTMLPIDSSRAVEVKPCYAASAHRERAAKPRYQTPTVSVIPDTNLAIGLPHADALANFGAS
jgi:Lrp/AsnC family transcriptional regulator, leucine-responsive regulatory protein